MDPDETVWHEGRPMSVLEWIEIERTRITEKSGKETLVKTKRGKMAIFRERMRK
tara:strand:+ start:376 stop:537 length:162 start_codon:yes stop_codon:yes gene_type:complete